MNEEVQIGNVQLNPDEQFSVNVYQDSQYNGFWMNPDGNLDGNRNGSDNQQMALMEADRKGGLPSRGKYVAALHDIARAYASEYNGTNREVLLNMAMNEGWFEGAEAVIAPDMTPANAQSQARAEIEFMFDLCTADNPNSVQMKDFDAAVNNYDPSQNSPYCRIAAQYDVADEEGNILRPFSKKQAAGNKLGEKQHLTMSEEDARANVDLYNLWAGKKWVNGENVGMEAWKDEFMRDKHPDEDANDPAGFYKHAKEFAEWAGERIVEHADAYKDYFKCAAREKYIMRLRQAQADNPNLTAAQRMRILDAVIKGKDGGDPNVPWDDPEKWGDLSMDDVLKLRAQRYDMYGSLALQGKDKALEGTRKEVEGWRNEAAAKKEAEKAAKTATKAAAGGKSKEKEVKIPEETLYKNAGWRADGGLGDGVSAEIGMSKFKELKETLGMKKGDRLYAVIRRGNNRYEYEVTSVHDDDKEAAEVLLSAGAARQMKHRRGQGMQTEGNDSIKFYVKRGGKK